jgi:AraC-like DNA-binding protein
MRALTGLGEDVPMAVEAAFQHPAPANAARYQQVLRCPVHFNQPEVRLVVRRELFDRPLRRPDPGLFQYLEQHAQTLDARLAERRSLSDQVRERLLGGLREGEPQQVGVARLLGMSERTLQRRLRDEGTTFAALLDDVRAEAARMYLRDPRLAVFEVAFLLGFSEASAFNRAFRRWTGSSPSDFRKQA